MQKLSHGIFLLLITITSVSSFADEKSIYEFKWLDEGEKVFVIQNKEHVKAGSFAVDASFIDSDSSPYQDTSGYMLALTYYISENWSIDLTYKQYNNSDSADLDNLINANASSGIKPIIRKINTAKIIHLNWIPFYGKINTFNEIFFFDWGLGLGLGQFDTEGNYKTFSNKNILITFEKEVDTGFNFRSFVKFYSKSNFTMGFEYNLTGVNTIKDPNAKVDTLFYTDIIGSIGYLF
jgi:outer membrane beta-barrel protein